MRKEINHSSQNGASRANGAVARRLRVALYSQDIVGLGHLRRNLLIAQTLARSELAATCLLITGAHETNFFLLPEGVDCLTLPRIGKDPRGGYQSDRLEISLGDLAKLRQVLIYSALEQFEPDVLIVDFRPTGVCDELLPALESLAQRGRTRYVLGLRDVIDDNPVVQAEWMCRQKVQAMERLYDAIWIYGDPRVFNPVREYSFPESISSKTRFTGYLDQTSRLNGVWDVDNCGANGEVRPRRETVACVVGGGKDGAKLIETFVDAVPPDIDGIALTGPYLPQSVLKAVRRAVAGLPNVQIVEFSPEADLLISKADRVVAMAGYNTVCSILSFGKPALLVPRVTPRREQLIRAEQFSKLKLVDFIPPDELTTENLAAWLRQPQPHLSHARNLVDLDGLDRIVEWVAELAANAGYGSPIVPLAALQS